MGHPELIVMLTWNDVTVKDSKKIFLEAKDAPAKFWGFKDVGLEPAEMKDLVDCMKAAGKTTFMESLAHTEEEAEAGVKIAIECGFDVLLGTHYFERTEKLAADNGLKHFPFVGERYDHSLHGKIEDIAAETKLVCGTTAAGVNVPVYRYRDGNPEELLAAVLKAADKPVSIAGSVNSFERIDRLKELGAWAFTIGGAFFEKKFGETFSEQIAVIDAYLKK